MEKNQTTGIILISALLLIYMFFMEQAGPPKPLPEEQKTEQTDSLTGSVPKARDIEQENTANLPDSQLVEKVGVFAAGVKGEEKEVRIQNPDLSLTISTKGGVLKSVLLKNYVTFDKKPLILTDSEASKIGIEIPYNKGTADIRRLYRTVESADERKVVLVMPLGESGRLIETYELPETGFTVNYSVKIEGANNEISADKFVFTWADRIKKVEKDMPQSRQRTTVNMFTEAGELENLSETSNDLEEMEMDQNVKWVNFKQKFFSSAILTEGVFTGVRAVSEADEKDLLTVKNLYTRLEIPRADLAGGKIRFYFGPNDYRIAGTVAAGFDENVDLGWAIFRYINIYVIMPLFEVLEGWFGNYGIVILILVILIKTALFPLVYKSYKSMGKMKLLKPEIDKIKEQYPDDTAKQQSETMALYGQVGVNPLSGCIPMALQMPVLFAMFNFFPNAIQLRQQAFLWADDLSSYDSILDLPFEIPFYGAHVSLFTILMTAANIVYTYYNNQMNTSMEGPMKSLPYVMQVFFLFILNNFSSGLTYYYCVSTTMTIVQQLSIRRFVDDEKILRVMEENRKKNQSKNPDGGYLNRKMKKMREKLEEQKPRIDEDKRKK